MPPLHSRLTTPYLNQWTTATPAIMAAEQALKPLEFVWDHPLSLVTAARHRAFFDRVDH